MKNEFQNQIPRISRTRKSTSVGRRKLFVIMILLLILPFFRGQGQGQNMDYAVHANIIYRFTKYIDWPDDKKSGDFVIGLIGDSPLYEQLQKLIANKSAGSQRIVVKRFSSSESTYECHILFIEEDESRSLKKIALRTEGLPVLLVSEEEGMATRGACINFALNGDRLKLEFNKQNIETRHLSVATELLQLGSIVK